MDFSPYGYDERQFCSPGFNLPVGRLSRTPHGEYPEYHTSADNLEFVRVDSLDESYGAVRAMLDVLEKNAVFVNLNPKGEPQLGKRGLYSSPGANELALLWVLNQSDGDHSLLDIAATSGLEFSAVKRAADSLIGADLLAEKPESDAI
jgi:aminopeptidase-like protein